MPKHDLDFLGAATSVAPQHVNPKSLAPAHLLLGVPAAQQGCLEELIFSLPFETRQ